MLYNAYVAKGLTSAEIRIANEVITGLTSRQVGVNVHLAEKTVKFHLTNIYRKIGVKTRGQLIVWSHTQTKAE